MAYTLSTRTIRKAARLGLGPVVERTITTIECDGAYYADVPAGEDAQALVAQLNAQNQQADEYRARFSDSDWDRQMDEAAGG